MIDTFVITIVCSFFFTLMILLVLWIEFNSRKTTILKNNEHLNTVCLQKIKEMNMKVSKVISFDDYYTVNANTTEKQTIFLDETNKKICFINYETSKIFVVDFSELINYEVYNNDTNLTIGTHGGGLFVGVFGSTSEKRIKELKLIIRLNQINNSQIVIPIVYKTFCNFGLSNDDNRFTKIMESLQQLCSILEVIKNDNLKYKI